MKIEHERNPDLDPLFDEIMVLRLTDDLSETWSIGLIQRCFGVGYSRATRIFDQIEYDLKNRRVDAFAFRPNLCEQKWQIVVRDEDDECFDEMHGYILDAARLALDERRWGEAFALDVRIRNGTVAAAEAELMRRADARDFWLTFKETDDMMRAATSTHDSVSPPTQERR